MNRKQRLEHALVYLYRHGYKIELTPRCRGLDLVLELPNNTNNPELRKVAFVAVMPLKRRHFPLLPFAMSKTSKVRLDALKRGATRWLATQGKGQFKCQFDAITVRDDGVLDHVQNCGRLGFGLAPEQR